MNAPSIHAPAARPRTPWVFDFREACRMALSAASTHPLRTALTLLGILVGVFSIILVMTAIRALQNQLETQMTQLGSQTFQVQRFPAIQVDDDFASYEKYERRKRFDLATALQLRDRAQLPKSIGLTTELDTHEARSRFTRTNPDIPLRGMSPEAFDTRNLIVSEGRALAQPDLDGARLVCVLGADLAKRLFPYGSGLGEQVFYRGIGYVVVGILEPKGSIFGQSQDSFMAIPISTGLERYGQKRSISIQVQAVNAAAYQDTMEESRAILRALRKVPPGESDDFEIVSNDSLVSQFRSLTLAIRIGAALISSIALVAAGVGIMNIMLVSVTERTREIGIRRALGAKKRHIMTQFIVEAVLLSEAGGFLGVVLGVAAGNLGALLLKTPLVLPVDWVLIGLASCSLVGIGFGTYPAWKAAQLDPIDSLRYE